MTFEVQPQALRAAAKAYDTSADHLAVARDYNQTHSQFEWYEEGLIAGANTDHDNLISLLRRRLTQATDLLGRSADELAKAADAYEGVDTKAAAQLDSSYPPVERADTRTRHGL
ncbi:type VII secretion target [Catellatospora chokoriensis]|uniref:Excreted virulence factor EspC (Type VII ESX diderm) n=1 Tax=Catellatospora chokoriensis TaxID=310353 RepID=A0A8J3NSF0_9ACTN|nr:type VII secretion target [Catellatospora chokoriensis]GIF90448.1 hypothetical protein Cch02nite_38920 [Catellatospora chokoriensis]